MVSRFPGHPVNAQARQRMPAALRIFSTSQDGAVTVDFVPLICAVIGLAIAVVSLLGASLTGPTARVSSLLDSVIVEESTKPPSAERPQVQHSLPEARSSAPDAPAPPSGNRSAEVQTPDEVRVVKKVSVIGAPLGRSSMDTQRIVDGEESDSFLDIENAQERIEREKDLYDARDAADLVKSPVSGSESLSAKEGAS